MGGEKCDPRCLEAARRAMDAMKGKLNEGQRLRMDEAARRQCCRPVQKPVVKK